MNSDVLLKKNLTPNKPSYCHDLIIGNRIPRDYFITDGVGESDITIHAGSFHLALKDAGIEICNIMTYSSILPGISREIKREKPLVHGAVMETIMAVADAEKGQRATTGIIYGWLKNKKNNEKLGGLVCEYNGNLSEKVAGIQLNQSLMELYENGYSEDYDLKDIRLISKSFVPKKKFGTSIVALCFVNYVYPVYGGLEL